MSAAIPLTIDAFEDLVDEIKTLCDDIDKELKRPHDCVDVNLLFRFYHTYKGAIRTYGFNKIAAHVHKIEDLLETIRVENKGLTEQQLKRLQSKDKKLRVMIMHVFRRLSKKLTEKDDASQNQNVALHASNTAEQNSMAKVFNRYTTMAKSLAKSLGKQVSVKVSGSDTQIDQQALQAVLANLPHLLSNAIDHGIESPSARLKQGKQQEGELKLAAWQRKGNFILSIADDGVGIDADKIRDIAIKKGWLIPEAAAITPDESILKMLFLPGFSHKESVSSISGRGVGMDALRVAVDELNGCISIRSAVNKGTVINISIPMAI